MGVTAARRILCRHQTVHIAPSVTGTVPVARSVGNIVRARHERRARLSSFPRAGNGHGDRNAGCSAMPRV